MTSRDGAGEAEQELTRALARLGKLIAESKDKKARSNELAF